MSIDEALREIKPRLASAFSERFRGVLLYGSEARRRAGAASDVDLLVLLAGPLRLGKDLETIVQALYPVQLEIDRPIHALPVSCELFEAGEYGLYRRAKQEGLML